MVNQALRTAADLLAEPIAGIGHNAGPAVALDTLADRLALRHGDLLKRSGELHEAALRAPAVDSDEAERKTTQFLAMVQECVARAKGAHKAEKAPWLEGGRIVDRFFIASIETTLATATAPLRRSLGEYKASKAKAAPMASTQARGDVAGLSTLRMTMSFKVIDINEVPRKFLALDEGAVMRALKAGETIPGIEKTETPDVNIRR